MLTDNREEIRRFFIATWQKGQRGEPLSPLERIVADTIAQHPEYHTLLGNEENALGADFHRGHDTHNPFLHMGMHISLQEQLGANRPAGIRAIFQRTAARTSDAHAAEHLMMECLGKILWDAQSSGVLPDEQRYLDCLRRIIAA